MDRIGEEIWLQRYPLCLAGCHLGRNVAVVRLRSGKLVIHSTADFPEGNFQSLGEPGWLVEATNFHDTCAGDGVDSLPLVPYHVPEGFSSPKGVKTHPILPAPAEWEGELEVIELGGLPKIREHVFFHQVSRTLIVADLLFNLPPSAGGWTLRFMRVMAGMKSYPAMSRLFRFCIRDREAFVDSLRKVAEWEFERIVVAHGDPIEGEDAKEQFLAVLAENGFEI